MHLYNSLTKKKELFRPIKKKDVGMYHCGPTVYSHVHIGNLRAFFLADITRRTFEYLGYKTKQVMNITDIGHLVSDGDTGEDKMTKGLRREGKEITVENMLALARKFEDAFVQDLHHLNIKHPHHLPRASEHIQEDIAINMKLEQKGYTYLTSDGLYFDTAKDSDYGALGGINHDSESRIQENTEKKNSRDFALWKFDKKLGWSSPWGKGFPGWHIECSGMSMKYLGETFDIHTGGHDLASIHHNNEIAQSESSTGKPFVRYWLHNEFLNVNGEKLSKSKGGDITLKTVLEKNIDPLAYRYLLLQAHYRSKQDFTWEALQASQTALQRLRNAFHELDKQSTVLQKLFKRPHWKYVERFREAMRDDLETPQALALTWELVKDDRVAPAVRRATLLNFDKVLGLNLKSNVTSKMSQAIPNDVQELLEERKKARANKDWIRSDELRDKIKELGFEVKDTDKGQEIFPL